MTVETQTAERRAVRWLRALPSITDVRNGDGSPAAPSTEPADAAATQSSGLLATRVVHLTVSPRQIAVTLLLVGLLVWPLTGAPYDALNTAILACTYLIISSSLVLLIGLVGQISLCQATLVGFGAFTTALVTQHAGLGFPFNTLVGVAGGAAAAGVVGVVALRVRGLFFAVATLIFAFVADTYLFAQPWLVGSASGTTIKPQTIGTPGSIPFLQLTDAHDFYYVTLAAAAFAVYAVANLRDSRLGRAFGALRGSEVAAASLGVDVVRTKLLAFLASGALAGLAGSLIVVGHSSAAPDQFNFIQSLFFLSVAVVGGLRSLGGSVASSLVFAILVGEVFYRIPSASNYLDLISAALLMAVLLFFRGGLGALPSAVRDAIATRRAKAARSITDEAHPQESDANGGVRTGALDLSLAEGLVTGSERHLPGRDASVTTLLSAEEVTVRFGGLTAVDNARLRVDAGEIVGLIGPNGAGKTTFFNALLGLNDPAAGRIELFGHDVSDWPVHRRAALGVGRTFQVIQLFPDLTVTDNLLVGTHLQNSTGLLGGIFATPRARTQEHAARARVATALKALGLTEFADRPCGSLPFGVLRMVEIARTIVTGAPLVCLDEPASGLDSAETERLIEFLHGLRDIGVALLVIEHDVAMVTRLCDRIYVLDRGRLIANGTPEEIQRDPAVIASYLGTEGAA